MLLYGDAPSTGEPTLELFRRALPAPDALRATVSGVLEAWGWEDALDDVDVCAATVLRALGKVEQIEVVAFRRSQRLTVELHCLGTRARFHELVGGENRIGIVDQLTSLWGVRPMGEGEAVWFEFLRPAPVTTPAAG